MLFVSLVINSHDLELMYSLFLRFLLIGFFLKVLFMMLDLGLDREFDLGMIICVKILYCSLVYVNSRCLSCPLDLLLFSCLLRLSADFMPLRNSLLYNFMGRSYFCSKRKLYVKIRLSFLVYTFYERFFSFFLSNEIFLYLILNLWMSLN